MARPVRWVLLCEHASAAVPVQYASLGLSRSELRDHIGWDIGARALQRSIARHLSSRAVASKWNRLVVDCNRPPDSESLILPVSDGVVVPGNRRVSAAERARRLRDYHAPYHAAVDRALALERRSWPDCEVRILSLHSFTPVMGGAERRLDVGVLYDEHVRLAHRLGRALRKEDFRVRYNEPYSGKAGLIYSARRHGRTHALRYVELEINNLLLRTRAGVELVAERVARALRAIDRPAEGERGQRPGRPRSHPATPRRRP